MTEDPLLTVEEVAKRLSIHVDTVRRWIRSGEIAAIDLGGPAGYRITQSELNRFIRDRATRRKGTEAGNTSPERTPLGGPNRALDWIRGYRDLVQEDVRKHESNQ